MGDKKSLSQSDSKYLSDLYKTLFEDGDIDLPNVNDLAIVGGYHIFKTNETGSTVKEFNKTFRNVIGVKVIDNGNSVVDSSMDENVKYKDEEKNIKILTDTPNH